MTARRVAPHRAALVADFRREYGLSKAATDDLDLVEWCQLVNGLSAHSVIVAVLAATVTSEPAAATDPDEFLQRLARHRGGPGQIVRRGGADA